MKSMIYLAFERMQTPEERALAVFAQKKGGPERILGNRVLLKEFLDMEEKVSANDDKGPTFGKDDRSGLTPTKLEHEIRKEVDAVLTEDTGAFERKFGAIELSLKEVNTTIQRQSDRVISEVLASMRAGPHERIKDKVCSTGFPDDSFTKRFLGFVLHMEGDGRQSDCSYPYSSLSHTDFYRDGKGA